MQARRALLFVPGDSRRKIDKAAGLGADCVCLDLEDGVAVSQKEAARTTIAAALREVDFGRSECLVRLNRPGSGLEYADLDAVIDGHPAGLVLPKVESGDDILWLDERLINIEVARGWPAGHIVILAMVETARGVVNLRDIASASRRLAGLIFGAEDLAGDVGATRTPAGWEIFYARSAVVTHAAAFGLQAIDMVYTDYKDPAGLEVEARQGAGMGYSGKQIIHPDQIAPVHAAFTPSAEVIAQAQRLISAFEAQQAAGRGAFAFDGKMVDRPMLVAAEQVLAKARAAGWTPSAPN